MTVTKAVGNIKKKQWQTLALSALIAGSANIALAGEREQAKRIHERIAGVPPSASVLNDMADDIAGVDGGTPLDAAFTAMNNTNFYNVTLKNWVAPWTNEAQTPFVPLNDYTATIIGMVRDNYDFRGILSEDVLYVAGPSASVSAYSLTNNRHYEDIEEAGYPLIDENYLMEADQSDFNGLPSNATAGILTSRAAARAYFSAGTNRAMFRFTMMHHMCNDMEQVNDVTRPPDRIRQDVSRSPGGDSRIFLNSCIGCHSGMDPLAQAFAYYDYEFDANGDPDGENGQLVYNDVGMTDPETGTRVKAKYHINNTTFEHGFVTPDDQWENYWREGPNSLLGWNDGGLSPTGSGAGAKTMGTELANSLAFAQCQVTKVFENVCLRSPVDSNDRNQIDAMVTSFKNNSYNLKQVFAESAVYCMGD